MNQSYWIKSSVGREYGPLLESEDCNCGIIGGGITGLTTAYLLSKKGKKVVLVEANKVGDGCTGRNTGKTTPQHNIIYSKIKKRYGIEKAKKYYEGSKEALNLVEKLIIENNIECGFEKNTSYIFAQTDKGLQEIKEEYQVCKEIGIDCEYMDEIPLPIEIKGAIAFNNVAGFNPKKYCDRLSDLVIQEGGKIFQNSPVVEVEPGEKCTFKTREGKSVQCEQLILASHFPFYDGLGFYFARLKPERSYIVAGYLEDGFVEGMYINVEDPRRSIHYISGENEHLLLIAGENHRVGEGEDEYYEILKNYGKDNFGISEYKYQWSAEDYTATDNIPYIGALNGQNDNIFVATGFGKWGMTNGSLSGIIISDLIVEGDSIYKDTFNPSRAGAFLSTELLKHNLDVAYHLIKGKLYMGETEVNIKAGEAKIVSIDGKRYGAFKEENNNICIVDITCTHVGCELSWNAIENSWDCPCHGSRFNYKGDILEGPATESLKRYGEGENKINPKIV